MSSAETKRGRMLIPISANTQNTVQETGIQVGDSRSCHPFVGQNMDSLSAMAGSRAPVIEQFSANETGDCTPRCARAGSFVLYASDTKTIYPVNDQKEPVRCTGQKVTVSETHDKWPQIRDIKSIEAANPNFLKFDSLFVLMDM